MLLKRLRKKSSLRKKEEQTHAQIQDELKNHTRMSMQIGTILLKNPRLQLRKGSRFEQIMTPVTDIKVEGAKAAKKMRRR